AGIAQLVEQLICNQQVAGSSPVASSNLREFVSPRSSVVEHSLGKGEVTGSSPVAGSILNLQDSVVAFKTFGVYKFRILQPWQKLGRSFISSAKIVK
ncbi:MAG: hypothetical protein US22_C0056G0008, partial [candidate division TM6 bacterium GW2011_GWF2_36_6]